MKRKGGLLVGRPFDVWRVCQNRSQDAEEGTLDGLGHIGCSDLADFFEAAVSSRAKVGQARPLLCAREISVLRKKTSHALTIKMDHLGGAGQLSASASSDIGEATVRGDVGVTRNGASTLGAQYELRF